MADFNKRFDEVMIKLSQITDMMEAQKNPGPAHQAVGPWHRRSPFQQPYTEFHHPGNREGRNYWQQGFLDPYNSVVQEEWMAGRFPQPAHQNWRRPYLEDRGYGAVHYPETREGRNCWHQGFLESYNRVAQEKFNNYLGIRDGRNNWQQGFSDVYHLTVQDERMAGRFPQPAHQNWRRPYFEDRGYGAVQQGGYGGDQQGEEQLAIISELVPMKIESIPLQPVHEISDSTEQIKKPLVIEAKGQQIPELEGIYGTQVESLRFVDLKPNDDHKEEFLDLSHESDSMDCNKLHLILEKVEIKQEIKNEELGEQDLVKKISNFERLSCNEVQLFDETPQSKLDDGFFFLWCVRWCFDPGKKHFLGS